MPPVLAPAARLPRLLAGPARASRVTHVEHLPARPGEVADWPGWVPTELVARLAAAGIRQPWRHQVAAAEAAWSGRSVVLATGPASGKSLGYLLPVLTALAGGRASALYLAPTRALAADQLRRLAALAPPGVRAACYDGDSCAEERDWARAHANLVLTNPDMLHRSLLPGHRRWAALWRSLRYVVVDECHTYRGVFGSHVALVLRRLRRVARQHGADPVFVLASATVGEPGGTAGRLTGLPVVAVTEDAAPRGPLDFALVEPPLLTGLTGEAGAPVRRSAVAETAELLAELVAAGTRTVAFVRSRRGAEALALTARRLLAESAPRSCGRVAAYRGGYLPTERRTLESALQDGRLTGLAATTALELGVDVRGLDAVLLAGWPGTVASVRQQAGRAGRAGQRALAVLVARDDPLDTYLVHHPEALFGRPVEATVLDPANPHVLAPHLCAAAAEVPLGPGDEALFGPPMAGLADRLVADGLLRRRPTGWYWTRRERPADAIDLRGGGRQVRVVEAATGRLLGTVDEAAAPAAVHPGAVYLHQGETFLVEELDLPGAVALVGPADPDYTTVARQVTDLAVVDALDRTGRAGVELTFGTVDVTRQVVGFVRRGLRGNEFLGEVGLDLPPRELRTQAVWWTVEPELLAAAGVGGAAVRGAAHAAEHAAIGLLPLFATCDRWDIGGVSTAAHPDTGRPTVFVYDGAAGGAGFAERGYRTGPSWLTATRDAVAACGCESGCPSCVQSPKCGNGNTPLDKEAAVRLLTAVSDRLRAPVTTQRRGGRPLRRSR